MGQKSEYTLVSRIGAGGTSSIWRVKSSEGATFAAKVPSAHRFTLDSRLVERLRREASILLRVDHPNVVHVEDVAAVDGLPVLIMDELTDGSVYDLLPGPFPASSVVQIVLDALAGLAALHSGGVVHRDISPKNLMFRGDGHVVVADLGAAVDLRASQLTLPGDRIGSLLYLSPQQFADPHGAEPTDDVYALGQVAYELLSGSKPLGRTPDLPASPVARAIEGMRKWDRIGRPSAEQATIELYRACLDETGVSRFRPSEVVGRIRGRAFDDLTPVARDLVSALTASMPEPLVLDPRSALPAVEAIAAYLRGFREWTDASREDEYEQLLVRLSKQSNQVGEWVDNVVYDEGQSINDPELVAVEVLDHLAPDTLNRALKPCNVCRSQIGLLGRPIAFSDPTRAPRFEVTRWAWCERCSDVRCPLCGGDLGPRPLPEPWDWLALWICDCPYGSASEPALEVGLPGPQPIDAWDVLPNSTDAH